MKFYYKGKLVRTSKNHEYTHAVICETEEGFKTVSCASSYDLAVKSMNNQINYWFADAIHNCRTKLDMMKEGRNYYIAKDGRNYLRRDIKYGLTIEEVENELNELLEDEKWHRDHYKVIELEKGE